jgi:hypothetical protein
MSSATLRSSYDSRGSGASEGSSSGWAFWGLVLAGLAVLCFLVAWLTGWIRFTTDPRVLEIRRLQEETMQKFQASGGPSTLADATAAVAAMGAIRSQVEALPPHLRSQVERSGRSMFRSSFTARMDNYFAQPADKRQKELDRQIDQEELMTKAMAAGQAVANALGGGGTSTANSGGAGGQPAGAGGGGGGNGGGPPRGGTEEDRNRWRKSMIDRTTPEQRARYVEYRRAMDERREQRGLPTSPWGR